MADKYMWARQTTRDYVRDLVRELRVAPSPMWAGTTWADYQTATRAKIAELPPHAHDPVGPTCPRCLGA